MTLTKEHLQRLIEALLRHPQSGNGDESIPVRLAAYRLALANLETQEFLEADALTYDGPFEPSVSSPIVLDKLRGSAVFRGK